MENPVSKRVDPDQMPHYCLFPGKNWLKLYSYAQITFAEPIVCKDPYEVGL